MIDRFSRWHVRVVLTLLGVTVVGGVAARTMVGTEKGMSVEDVLSEISSPLFSNSFSIPDTTSKAYGVAAAAAASDSDSEEKEKHQHEFKCVFRLDNLEFNLCPLLRAESGVRRIEEVKETPPTVTKRTYELALRHPLDQSRSKLESSSGDEAECPPGTWVCLKITNTRPKHASEPPRLLQLVPIAGTFALEEGHTREKHPGLNATVMLYKQREGEAHRTLGLVLQGGKYVDVEQRAMIRFTCDHKADNNTAPSFRAQWGGWHVFSWATSHACPNVVGEPKHPATLTATPGPQRTDAPEEGMPEEDADGGKEEFLLPDIPLETHRKRIATVVGAVILFLAVSAYMIYTHLPDIHQALDRYRHGKSTYTHRVPSLPFGKRKPFAQSPFNFRVGERRLLKWSEEDYVNLGDDNDDDDFMVNARAGGNGDGDVSGADDWPLAPSPRKGGGGHKSYGSMGGASVLPISGGKTKPGF